MDFWSRGIRDGSLMAGHHRISECGMDRPSIDRRLRLERAATVYHSRSRRRLRRRFHWTPQSHGHTRPPDLSSITLAIGSIRRNCLDHVVIFGEQHLRHLLSSYLQYYNEVRPHLSLEKDAVLPREVKRVGRVLAQPILGGLHHRYVRV